jgi:small subunit ribosomal protein S8
MSVIDPIADMLNRIRNAHGARQGSAQMPYSKMKTDIARILKREGFIADYVVEGGEGGRTLRLFLKYHGDREPTIRGMKRISTPGLRRYVRCEKLPRVLGGMGVAVLSTAAGIVTDAEARKLRTGGEVLFHIW